MPSFNKRLGNLGFGFSIAGGIDNANNYGDVSIIVTKVLSNNLLTSSNTSSSSSFVQEMNGPCELSTSNKNALKVKDVILKVNSVDTTNVTHGEAVSLIKQSGDVATLEIKRKVVPMCEEESRIKFVKLQKKNGGFGFTISGGIGNEHIVNDSSIYITKIIGGGSADSNKELSIGDKILKVDGYSLQGVTHDEAVHILKSSTDTVSLLIQKQKVFPQTPSINSRNGLGDNLPSPSQTLSSATRNFLEVAPRNQRAASPIPPEPLAQSRYSRKDNFRAENIHANNEKSFQLDSNHFNNAGTIPISQNDISYSKALSSSESTNIKKTEWLNSNHHENSTINTTAPNKNNSLRMPISSKKSNSTTLKSQNDRVSNPKQTQGFENGMKQTNQTKHPNTNNGAGVVTSLHNALTNTNCFEDVDVDDFTSGTECDDECLENGEKVRGNANNNGKKDHHHHHQNRLYHGINKETTICNSSSGGCDVNIHQGEQADNNAKMNQISSIPHPPKCHVYNVSRSDSFRRLVSLHRGGSGGLGFNIVGGEEGYDIFISYIIPCSSADLSKNIFIGDTLLCVNEHTLSGVCHEDAAYILKTAGDEVELLLESSPEKYEMFKERMQEIQDSCSMSYDSNENLNNTLEPGSWNTGTLRTCKKKSFYVRTLFDYDPSTDEGLPSSGLSFRSGDILFVINASDDEWWRAALISNSSSKFSQMSLNNFPNLHHASATYGVVPSKLRVERKERRKLRYVKFQNAGASSHDFKYATLDGKKRKNFHFTKKFPFMKSKDNISYECATNLLNSEGNGFLNDSANSSSSPKVSYTRPVLILGAFKEKINDDLISEFPEKFESCVPHTTRSKRELEVDGCDYHFISKEEMQEMIKNHAFIEAGQYNNNIYGTSLKAVQDIAYKRMHCLLDVSANAIKRLQSFDIYPISILIQPVSLASILEINKRLSEEQSEIIYEKCFKILSQYKEIISGIVKENTYDEIYERVKEAIDEHSVPSFWVQVSSDIEKRLLNNNNNSSH